MRNEALEEIKEIRITSLHQYVKDLKDAEDAKVNTLYYRGQADCSLEPKPSIFRENWIHSEHRFIREMVRSNPDDFRTCNTTIDTLVKMQYYGAPTRLLDLTESPLIALYFACQPGFDRDGKPVNGNVIIFETKKNSEVYSDNDVVAIISNLSRIKDFKQGEVRGKKFKKHESIIETYSK
ncbi:hypothetical protein AGMMS49944_31240 [Spirochaetia bacterium]|nr:hypothetical protein AGMMS49944_31240 [Spirochaetia bacterium]